MKKLPGDKWISKPAVHRLDAEVPCNYICCRLAAALQSLFEIPFSPYAFSIAFISFFTLNYNEKHSWEPFFLYIYTFLSIYLFLIAKFMYMC